MATSTALRIIAALLAGLLLLGAAVAGAAAWLVATPGGLVAGTRLAQWVVPNLEITPGHGTIWHGPTLARLAWHDGTLALEARDVVLRWQPRALTARHVHIAALEVAQLTLRSTSDGTPPQLPDSLRLPVTVDLDRLAVGTLAYASGDSDPVTLQQLTASLHGDAASHRLAARFSGPSGDVKLQGTVATAAPFATRATAQLRGQRAEARYTAGLGASGTLAHGLAVALRAQGYGLSGRADLQLAPFAPQPVSAIDVALDAFELRALVPGAPAARLTAQATLTPQGAILTGPLALENLTPGRLDAERIPLAHLSGALSIDGPRVALTALRAELHDGRRSAGRMEGRAAWDGTAAQLALRAHGVDARVLHTKLRGTLLSGPLTLSGNAARQSLQAELADRRMSLAVDASHADGALEVRTLRLAAGRATLALAGHAGLAEGRSFDVAGRFDRFDPAAFADLPHALLNGTVRAKGHLEPAWQADVELALADSRLLDQPLVGQGLLRVAPGRISRADLRLELAGNRLAADGAFGGAGDVLHVKVQAPQLSRLGQGLGIALGGSLELDGRLGGDIAQPAGSARLAARDLQLPGFGLAHADGELRLEEGIDGAFHLALQADGLRTAPDAVLAERVELRADGSRARHDIRLAARRPKETLAAALQGGLGMDSAGNMAWSGSLVRFEIDGDTPFAVTLRAPATLYASRAEVALGEAELAGRRAQVRLTQTRWTPQGIVSRGSLTGLAFSLERDLLAQAPPRALRLGADWDLTLAEQAAGRARVFRESGDLWVPGETPVSLGLERLSLEFLLRGDALEAQFAATGSRLGEVEGRYEALLARDGALWRLREDAPHTGRVSLQMPSLGWLAPLLGANASTAGRVGGEFHLDGTPGSPVGSGTVAGDRLAVSVPGSGLHLDHGSLRMTLAEDRLRLDELRFDSPLKVKPRDSRIDTRPFEAAPGQFSADGEVRLADRQVTLRLAARRLLALQRPDRWVAASGEGTLGGTPERLAVKGAVKVDAAAIEYAELGTPQLSDDVVIKGRAPRAAPLRVAVDVAVDLGNRFYFHGRGLDTRLVGNLAVRSDPLGRLSAVGTIATRGGTFNAYGRELEIERGAVNFQGPLDNAGLNVRAMRRNQAVEAGVEVTGTVQRPVVRLVSEPDVPEAEKLSWMVLGRGGDTVSGDDASQLLGAASTLLGGDGDGLTSRIAKSFGLDEIGLSQGEVGAPGGRPLASGVVGGSAYAAGSGLTTQIVTVGKRLSSRAHLSYEQSLDGAANIVKLTYSLSRRLSLIGRAGADNAVDLRYLFSFD